MTFLTCFFKNLPAAHKDWPKQGLFRALKELGKSIWSTLKKGRQNLRNIFENPPPPPPSKKNPAPPPRKNPRSAPDYF